MSLVDKSESQGTYDFGTYPIGKNVQTRQNLRFLHTQSMEIEEFRSLDTYSMHMPISMYMGMRFKREPLFQESEHGNLTIGLQLVGYRCLCR